MRVYRPQDAAVPRHTLFVQPGRAHPITDWLDEDGKPRMFSVAFVAGSAEVPENLGQYLIDSGNAFASPLILPPGAGLRDTHARNVAS